MPIGQALSRPSYLAQPPHEAPPTHGRCRAGIQTLDHIVVGHEGAPP